MNLRHGAATMDTLISLGTLAAFGWSVYALFWGDAGMPGMKMSLQLPSSAAPATSELYLEVASAVTVFILAGRYFEARAKRRSGAALRALLDLGAKDVAVLRDGAEVARSRSASWPSATGSWCARREGRHRRRRSRRAPRPSTPRC